MMRFLVSISFVLFVISSFGARTYNDTVQSKNDSIHVSPDTLPQSFILIASDDTTKNQEHGLIGLFKSVFLNGSISTGWWIVILIVLAYLLLVYRNYKKRDRSS
ncbi:MAG TPA: hypothetical protein VK783_02435 [Bacteroidia bacterium]|jgi:hypothetical protein|nr:hypothetical protein [Bacteroidia bacterium]